MAEITVGTFLKEKSEDLKLEMLSGHEGLQRQIIVSEINRPGLTFTGYIEHFSSERIQIIGLGEYSYLKSLPQERQKEVLDKIFSFSNIPCFILARGLEPLPVMLEYHQRFKVPLLKTELSTSQLMAELIYYLQERMSETTSLHGVLVNVYGLGVLLLGDAGIGKSECALELVKRNHMLVADDMVKIRHYSGGILIGEREEVIQHHMELRGLGIIDIYSLFGVGFILDKSRIELVIRLEEWKPDQDYERIGLEERMTSILGVKVPEITFPVRPGRNIAVLVEVASLNQRLKNRGLHSAQEFNQRLIQIMAK